MEVPARERRSKVIAVLYSGDGGWRDLDRSLASVLAGKGMSVVGVDVLRYYWRTRQPDSAARDLARIVHSYKRRWGGEKVVLIGFSFGANVIPFIVNRLPADVRSDIRLITLLSPERTTAFEVSPAGWVGKASDADDSDRARTEIAVNHSAAVRLWRRRSAGQSVYAARGRWIRTRTQAGRTPF